MPKLNIIIEDIYNSLPDISHSIIELSGGAYSHLNHPFDDMDLTFDDLKEIIRLAFSGKLENVSEKTDGQNIMISYRNGNIISARNKTDIINKNKGKRELINQFKGRGEIENAFTFAINDLEKAFDSIPKNKLKTIFDNGNNFLSLEIIYIPTQNVIPYNRNMLIFHGIINYNQSGERISSQDETTAKYLSDIIKETNSDLQDKFQIFSKPKIEFNTSPNFKNKEKLYITRLNNLQNKFGLKDNDKVILYHRRWWKEYIQNKALEFNYNIPEGILHGLIERFGFFNKKYSMLNIKKEIDNNEFKKWASDFEKEDRSVIYRKNMSSFENIFLSVGIDVINMIKNLLVLDKDEAKKNLADQLNKKIKEINSSNNIEAINKLKVELERLNNIGGIENIMPTEGLTFEYKGKIFKLVGKFAPINQILGIMKY